MLELQDTELGPMVELLASPQGEGIRNMLQILINAGMLAERRAFDALRDVYEVAARAPAPKSGLCHETGQA